MSKRHFFIFAPKKFNAALLTALSPRAFTASPRSMNFYTLADVKKDDAVVSPKRKGESKKKEEKKESLEDEDDSEVEIIDMDDDTGDEVQVVESPKKKAKTSSIKTNKGASPTKKSRSPAAPKSAKKKASGAGAKAKEPKKPPLKPSAPLFDRFEGSSTALEKMSFVFTGVMGTMSREEGEDYVKMHGGRVTSAVSGKTSYLVMGSELEDGRPTTAGSKYRKALDQPEKTVMIDGEYELYALVKLLHEKVSGSDATSPPSPPSAVTAAASAPPSTAPPKADVNDASAHQSKASAPCASAAEAKAVKKVVNPYANVKKASVGNPYANVKKASVGNPYAKSSKSATSRSSSSDCSSSQSSSPRPSTAAAKAPTGGGRASITDSSALWADKYAPSDIKHILGNRNHVEKLRRWILSWEDTFLKGRKPHGMSPRAALLSGPPGIGKTTAATLVAKVIIATRVPQRSHGAWQSTRADAGVSLLRRYH